MYAPKKQFVMHFIPLVLGYGRPTQSPVWRHLTLCYSPSQRGREAPPHFRLLPVLEPHNRMASPQLTAWVSAVLILGDVDRFEQGFDF